MASGTRRRRDGSVPGHAIRRTVPNGVLAGADAIVARRPCGPAGRVNIISVPKYQTSFCHYLADCMLPFIAQLEACSVQNVKSPVFRK